MKNSKIALMGLVLFSLLAGFGAFMLSLSVTPELGVAFLKFGIVSMAVSFLAQKATGIELYSEGNLLFCTTLIGLKRQCNNPTLGGIKRLYLVLCEDLLNDFLSFNLALTAGEFAGPIPLVVGKKFIEIEAWYDTTKADGEMKAGAGFTQGMEFKVLGYNKDIVKLQTLLYETPVCVIVQGNDDRLYFVGSKYIPMIFDAKLSIPEKGTARKEVTFMAKNEGFQNPVMPLAATATFEVEALV